MPKPPLPDELQALLREPNPAVMASLKADGSPLTVPTIKVSPHPTRGLGL